MEKEIVDYQTCSICKDVGLIDKLAFISPEHTEVIFSCKDERACAERLLRRDRLAITPLLCLIRSRPSLTKEQALMIIMTVMASVTSPL